MSKRPRDHYDMPESSTSPPARRMKLSASSPILPSTSKLLATPHIPYAIRTPYSAPTDSPTNPFGLKRSLYALELPKATAFGKHTPIRMQLVTDTDLRPSTSNRRSRGGVYRVVQVPNNYTFRHLHKLILYLFASDIHLHHNSKSQPNMSLLNGKRPLSRKAAGKARADVRSSTWGGHYFEAQKKISTYPEAKHPGTIKPGGKTFTKLSSVRDRQLFRDLCDPSLDLDTSLPATLEDEDAEKEEWSWEAEDDFTLRHVWPDGPELEQGIIYHHSPSVRIHITVNTLPIPFRKGYSNTPFVFLAQGTTGSLIQIAHTVPDSDGNESYSPLDSEPDFYPLPLPSAYIERWNKQGVFEKFLKREAERERALRLPRSYDPEEDDRDSSEPPPVPSSDGLDMPFLSSTDEYEGDANSIYSTKSTKSDSFFYPSSLSAATPFPQNPLRKKRLDRLGKRMAKLTRSGLRDVMSSDEEEKKLKKTVVGKRVDTKNKWLKSKSHIGSKAEKVVEKMKGKGLAISRERGAKSEEVRDETWDPFGDEDEV
ncbi:hypothetical protein BDY19DRAFT_969672 [Irpex rosettiformis]|uniref:Uncharacterized protein n=1 Tax=Irpex rosettiformis TaxID=378272 RepID=A0ACB8TRW9_9APHY|nr:hypothetical protein BDY19DRAFT_969672 [Irpex rosettiformis]